MGTGGETGTYLYDFVTGEFEFGDVGSVAGHEVAVENAQDGLVGDDEKVVFFAL